ncbi:MAG: hypothetical protein UU42_C0006G0029 [Candidatus Woesebacteria bacterium GW2011_GWA1_41_13b]|uniref:DUF2283 domain-containing protein n=1 Tax=Candidatus Woesebacteria bacterium GW2011_GWA1_41_13b TaxID=1618555 RepID=A0A0G0X5Q7_9BACT|nr:MAG: hypothetical protein UU42_C0006G0029 [Candidatus Woesebacteria bacterium GW2011_GWA1_41_13b]
MKVTYDKKADAMYIYFVPGKKSTRTEEVGEGLLVDYSGKKVIGIEILDASKVVPNPSSGKISFTTAAV